MKRTRARAGEIVRSAGSTCRSALVRLAHALGFDAADARTLIGLVLRAAIVVGYAATFGLAIRIFLATSGLAEVFGWGF